jgi:hypothetical protein
MPDDGSCEPKHVVMCDTTLTCSIGRHTFVLPCIIVYQYNGTNMMHFSINLWRIKVAVKLLPCHSQLTLYARNIPNAVCVGPPEDEKVLLETCRGP